MKRNVCVAPEVCSAGRQGGIYVGVGGGGEMGGGIMVEIMSWTSHHSSPS